jgi:hypothetical protein
LTERQQKTGARETAHATTRRVRAKARRVRAKTRGAAAPGELLDELAKAFDSVGKIAAGLAALGGLAYLVALAVIGLRLKKADLPSTEVLSAIPRDHLLVAGTIELLMTVLIAALLVVLAFISRRSLLAQAFLLLALVAILPWSVLGAVWLGVTGVLVALLRFWRKPPAAVVIGAVAVAAVTLTLVRQAEFPSPFASARVALEQEPGEREKLPISGKYLGATSDEVLVGVRDRVVMIPRARVDRLALASLRQPIKSPESLLARLGVELTCLIPTCRSGEGELVTPY